MTTSVSADLGHPIQAALEAAIKPAISNVKGLASLLFALGGLALAYYVFEDKVKLHEPWPVAICGGFVLIFILLFFLPELHDQLKLQRLRIAGIHGQPVSPSYFRLTAYETDEADSFGRADGAAIDVCRWIETSPQPILYLCGQSGVGKSSLINAAIVPSMTAAKWIVLPLRSHNSPLRRSQQRCFGPMPSGAGRLPSRPGARSYRTGR